MNKISVLIILSILASSALFGLSDNAGTSEMTFLKMAFSPKAASMGGAGVGYAKGPHALLSNPASMSFERDLSVGTSFGVLYAGITGGDVVAQKGFDFGKLGMSVRFISYGTMERTNIDGDVIGDFSATDLALSVAYSREIFDKFSFGIAPFFASSSIDSTSAAAIGVDMGVLMKFDYGRGQIGAVLKNAGTVFSAHLDSAQSLPLNAGVGASYRLKGLPVFATAQGDWFADEGFTAGFGIDFMQLKPLSLRLGYKLRDKIDGELAKDETLRGLTAGFGIDYRGMVVDYAFEHYGELGMTHKFGLAYEGFGQR